MATIAQERLFGATILVIDDSRIHSAVIEGALSQAGYYNIICVQAAQEVLASLDTIKPDLIILDVMMPDMNGIEFCEHIRKMENYAHLPIIAQTALTDIQNKLAMFKAGASDYVCKPVEREELLARVHLHLCQRYLIDDLARYQQRMDLEIHAARHIQRKLMPDMRDINRFEQVFNVQIASHAEATLLGGDCWGARALSDKLLALYIFDFSGHGMGAALNVFRMQVAISECQHAMHDPGLFLSALNRVLYPMLERSEFATMFYSVLDTDANCLFYAGAAMHPGIMLSRKHGKMIKLDAQGLPLGTMPSTAYDTRYAPFLSGDLLMLYSDGVIETPNTKGECLNEDSIGEKALSSYIFDNKRPAQLAVNMLIEQLRKQKPAVDDTTINAFYRNVA